MQIINMTPHAINVILDSGEIEVIPPSGKTIRLKSEVKRLGNDGRIPLSLTKYYDVEGLPERKPDVYYVVSALVKQALYLRGDLLVPAEIIRDENNHILGCRSLGV